MKIILQILLASVIICALILIFALIRISTISDKNTDDKEQEKFIRNYKNE